jgi:hypothetical protein
MSRRILSFALFEAKIGLTPEQEEFLNKYTKGTWTLDPSTGLVDVEGDFNCAGYDWERGDLKDFEGVKFGKVSGNFDCSLNKLTSLAGAPKVVDENFYCRDNKLTSLAGAPQEVGEGFYCEDNNLTSLVGAPQKVRGGFDCFGNKLTSLVGAPQEVGEGFGCKKNKLTSLVGAPQKVRGGFDCFGNKLTSLVGAPQEVGEGFYCDAFKLKEGEWNYRGWFKVMGEGTPEAQQLMGTLVSPDVLNREIQKDPAGMAMKLKGVWNDESFKETRAKLIWPKGYGEKADLVGDLDDLGF